jgi:RNA polymerase sigma factor (sigma-70 family)
LGMRDQDFERLYAEHARPLLAFITYRTGDPVLAEDVLADTFERVLRSRWRFDPRRSSEKTWIYTIALNLLRDHARRNAVKERAGTRLAAERTSGGGAGMESAEARVDLAAALDGLNQEEREVVALRYGAGLTLPEIAGLTRQKLTTVEGRLYRALRKLHRSLSETQ